MKIFRILLLLMYPALCLAGNTLRACGGQSEWPPSSYLTQPGNKVEGYSADTLQKIFETAGYTLEIQLLPWPRCLAEVQKGTDYHIAMAGTRSAEREAKFIFSRPYLYLTPGYIRSGRQELPPGDIQSWKKCGVNGFNYQAFQLPAEQIDSTANNYLSVINKLKIGRCDILLEYTEVAQALMRMERHGLHKDLYKAEKLPAIPPVAAHFMLGINAPQSARLEKIINSGLIILERNGQLNQLLAKHTTGRP